MSKRILDFWESYRQDVLHKPTEECGTDLTSFLAGAMSAFHIVKLAGDATDPAETLAAMVQLGADLRAARAAIGKNAEKARAEKG